MRIAYTINNLDTAGMKLVVADLVQGLDRQRFAPRVAVGRRTGSGLERRLEDCCEVLELPLHLPRRPLHALWRSARDAARKLACTADLVHSFDYSSDWTEGLAVRLAGMPWVIEKTNLVWSGRRWWLRSLLASRIVCLSQAQAVQMSRWRRKVTVVPTGVDLARFGNAHPAPREALGLSETDLVMACVAHLVPVKGHAELLRAVAAVAGGFPHLRLVLAGEGAPEYERELRALATTLGIEDRVRFLGRVDDIPALLKASDGAILATRNEGRREAFGAALVEAMAAGLPVIGTRSGGPEEIILHEQTGWLVETSGWQALAEAIGEFCRDPARRRRYGEAGLRRASSEYDRELMVRRYEAVYESVHGARR